MRLLIYEPAYLRVKTALAGMAVTPIVMGADGTLSDGAGTLAPEAAGIEAGWLSSEVFSGPVRAFMVALLKSPVLDWVQSGAAGFDDPVFARFLDKGARLTNSSAQSIPIAEYVLANVLDHFQGGPERRAAQQDRRWLPVRFREAAGTVWLVVGFGAIGQAVAKRVRAFDGDVIGVRRQPGPHELADRMVTPDDLAAVLPQADVVVLSLPLTAETQGLADGGFFAAMKPGSVLVNVGRGGLVDEEALQGALANRIPERAILDVFATEPLPEGSPLWSHPRVGVTAHAAAMGSGREARGDALFLENLRRKLAGEPLLNEVTA